MAGRWNPRPTGQAEDCGFCGPLRLRLDPFSVLPGPQNGEAMRNNRRADSRVWPSLSGKILGALALRLTVVTPIEVWGAGPAGAAPTISFVLAGNLSTGVPTPALTGTGFVDAGITPLLVPTSSKSYTNFSPLPIRTAPPLQARVPQPAVAASLPAVKPTLFGWLGTWNTTNTLNGTYDLVVFAEDVDNAAGTVYSGTTSAPIPVTVNNPSAHR